MLKFDTNPLGDYQTNCYLVWDDASKSCVVIDPGYTPQTVLRRAAALGLTVEAVLLTHGHFDHVGGVAGIAEATGCPVYISSRELTLPPAITAGPLRYTNTYPAEPLHLAGLTFEILETPGHTPGSVCLLAEDAMFAGDTLFAGSCGRVDLPGGSPRDMRDSLDRLRQLKKNYRVLPGHGPASTLEEEKRTNPYLQGRWL